MKKIKISLAFLVVIGAIGIGLISYAQPEIPKENIPSDIPSKVREQIEKLYTPDLKKRAEAAYQLGQLGEQAVPAIPFLDYERKRGGKGDRHLLR